jgi:putative flippase GtrA
VRINVRRWGVFNLVGFAGFVLQIGAITLLTRRYGWPPFAATAVALELAALQNFLAHNRWTWGDRPESSLRGWLRRYGRYQAAKTASLLANLAITTAVAYAGAPTELANTVAVLLCAIPNFLVSEHLVFQHSTNP